VLRIRLSHGNNLDVTEHRGTVAGSTDRDPGAPRRGVGLGGQPLVSDGDPLVWPGGAWHGCGLGRRFSQFSVHAWMQH
jgi:hypothetical protein